MAEVEAEPGKRRRRKSSSRKKAATWTEYWRSAEFERHLLFAMCLVGLAYFGTIFITTRLATFHYGDLWLKASGSEVRYMLGPPAAVEDGGTLYRYSQTGRELTVQLSPAGRTVSIRCQAAAQGPSTCPEASGIGIGTTEDKVLLRLGAPSRAAYRGNDKTSYYDGMGLTLRLSQFKVREIEVREGASFTGYFPHALLAAIP
jgi:hypothetical protein